MNNTINQLDKKKCFGCRSCEQVCPKKCIKMKDDHEGFLMPFINKIDCINCGLCVRSCPALIDMDLDIDPIVYAATNKNQIFLKESTSGGIFRILAEHIIEKGGVVFGCAWNEELVAEHICVLEKNDLHKLSGSKYVQSNTKSTFSEAKKYLDSGVEVLYSGTSCQIAGLKAYLRTEYLNLLTVDVICHGVPSPLLFKKYLKWQENRIGKKIIGYNFRSKENAYWGQSLECELITAKKRSYIDSRLDPYYHHFLKSNTYRESCYSCKYANKNKMSDITLGDYWGVGKFHPHMSNKFGTSIININSYKAQKLIYKIEQGTYFQISNYTFASTYNENLINSSKRTAIRDDIYEGINSKNLSDFFSQNLKINPNIKIRLFSRVPSKIKYFVKKKKKGR